jgi:Icc protein
VRLCLSGHAHQHERGDYLGVKYLCDGAVCGNWWSGDSMNFPPAYVVVDLYSDGSSDHTFIAHDKV